MLRRAARAQGAACSSTTSSSRTASATSSGASATRSTRRTTRRSRRSTGTSVEKSYETMDEIVGETARALGPRGRADRPVGPRLRDVAALRQLQLLARRERLPRPEGQRAAPEPRGALLARTVLGGGRLDEVEGLRDGPRATSTSTCRGRENGGIVAPGAEYEALRAELVGAPDGPDRPEERRDAPSRGSSSARTSTGASTRGSFRT